MAVRVEKPEFNLRDKLSQLDRRVGSNNSSEFEIVGVS